MSNPHPHDSARSADGTGADSELLLRELLGTTREPLLLLDAEARVISASGAFLTTFDFEAAEILGRSVYQLAEGDWEEALRQLIERRAAQEELIELAPISFRRGPVRNAQVTVRPIRGGANWIRFYLLSFDTSGAADRAGRAAIEQLVVRHATDLLLVFARDGSCLYAGPASQSMLGYSQEEMRAMTACDVVHTSDRSELEKVMEVLEATELARTVVWRVRRKDGGHAWLETTIRRVTTEEWPDAVLTSSRDISARKRAEEALQWLGKQTKLILDSAGEGIFGVDKGGRITFVNPAAARMLGATVPELLGAPYREFLGTENGAERGGRYADPVREALEAGGRRTSDRHTFRRRGGLPFPVEFTCTPAIDTGAVVGAVVTFRDITERLEAVEALRRAERLAATGEMLMVMRHEINNPLTTLLAGASMLEMGGNDPEEEREMVASIAEQARRIRDAIRRLGEREGE